jgi:hypothetical protein
VPRIGEVVGVDEQVELIISLGTLGGVDAWEDKIFSSKSTALKPSYARCCQVPSGKAAGHLSSGDIGLVNIQVYEILFVRLPCQWFSTVIDIPRLENRT